MSSWTSGADASTGSYGGCRLVYFGSYSTALATNRQSCESPAAIEPVCTLLAFGDYSLACFMRLCVLNYAGPECW
jgi:hypothetical protein